MGPGTTLAAALAATLALAAPAIAARAPKGENLLRVITPTAGGTSRAHPFVNVIVRFGAAKGGAPADPATFRARLGRKDITKHFVDEVENGVVVGKRASLDQHTVRVDRGVNRLRASVRAQAASRKKRVRDVDRIRFRAVDAPDQAPVAQVSASSLVVLPRVPVVFDARGSYDPDDDALTYHWDFGDGTTSTEQAPTKVYDDGVTDLVVRLTVSDGQLGAADEETLYVTCPLAPGRTPGVLRVEAPALELGAVPPGGSATQTVTIRNLSTDPASQLCVRLGTQRSPNETTPFTVVPAQIDDIPAGGEAQVTLGFAPTAVGHARGGLTVVGSSTNRPVVHLLAHGYGGTAAGTGPTFAPEPVFSNVFSGGTFAILPDGARVAIDNNMLSCQTPEGFGTRDLCFVDADCTTPGEICAPGTESLVDPVDMCSDGSGNLYILSDEGTYSDPTGEGDVSVTLLRLRLDAGMQRVGAEIIQRTTAQTYRLACDRRPARDLYVSKFVEMYDDSGTCREEWENLERVSTKTGGSTTLLSPIDKAVGEDPCDGDIDEVGDLQVTMSGKFSAFATFQRRGGLFRIAGEQPTPKEIIQDLDDTFAVHPDGSILYAATSDVGTTGSIRLYKVSVEHAVTSGPVQLDHHTPCAVFSFPNNQGFTRLGENSIAATRAAPGSPDAIVLVSFRASEGAPPVRGAPLAILQSAVPQGTVAFLSPAGDAPCTTLGLINVEQLDPLVF